MKQIFLFTHATEYKLLQRETIVTNFLGWFHIWGIKYGSAMDHSSKILCLIIYTNYLNSIYLPKHIDQNITLVLWQLEWYMMFVCLFVFNFPHLLLFPFQEDMGSIHPRPQESDVPRKKKKSISKLSNWLTHIALYT